MNVDEDLTMIGLPQVAPMGRGSDKENLGARMGRMGHSRGRTNSRDEGAKSTNGPLSTFARDLKKSIIPKAHTS